MRWTFCLIVTLCVTSAHADELRRLADDLLTGDVNQRIAARDALVTRHGRDAVPALRAALKHLSPLVRLSAAEGLHSLAEDAVDAVPELTELVRDRYDVISREAVEALAEIGPPARSAAPALHALAEAETNPARRVQLAELLVRLDPLFQEQAVDLVKPFLRQHDADVSKVCEALASLGEPGVRCLARELDRVKPTTCYACADALALHGPPPVAAVPALGRALAHSKIRSLAIAALVRCGPEAAPAMPSVVPFLLANPAHADEFDRLLVNVGPRALPDLVTLVREGNANVREIALRTMASLGPLAGSAVSEIIPLLDAGSMSLRESVIDTLRQIGPPAIAALPRLRQLAREEPSPTRRQAILVTILAIEPPSLDRWRSLHRGPDPLGWKFAYFELQSLGSQQRFVLPEIREAIRRHANPLDVAALSHFGDEVLPDLIELCCHADAEVRKTAHSSVQRLPSVSADALPELVWALTSPHAEARGAAHAVLRQLGPAGRPAVAALRQLAGQRPSDAVKAARATLFHITANSEYLGDALEPVWSGSWERSQLVSAIERMDVSSEDVLKVLADLAVSNHHELTVSALGMLQGAGPRAKAVLPKLWQPDGISRSREWIQVRTRVTVGCGADAVPSLLEAMRTGDADHRYAALLTLAALGPAAREAVPTLRQSVKEPTATARLLTACALACIDPKESIADALWEEDTGHRDDWSIVCPDAVRPLRHILRIEMRHPVASRRTRAVEMLVGAPAVAVELLPELRLLLRDRVSRVRRSTLARLEEMGESARPAIPDLYDLLADEEQDIRLTAGLLLVDLRADCREALRPLVREMLPVVVRWRERGEIQVGWYRLQWEMRKIIEVAGVPTDLVPLLRAGLTDRSRVEFAAWALSRCVSAAREAVPDLIAVGTHHSGVALAGLATLDPDAARPVLRLALESPTPQVRLRAALELLRFGGADRERAVAALHADLRSREVDGWAGWCAEVARRQPAVGVPLLARVLASPEAAEVTRAVETLAELGEQAANAVPALRRLHDTGPARLRAAAEDALKRIER